MPFDQSDDDNSGGTFIITVFKPGVVADANNTTRSEICCTGHCLELLATAILHQAVPVRSTADGEMLAVPLENIESIYIGGEIGKNVEGVLKEFNRVFANKRN